MSFHGFLFSIFLMIITNHDKIRSFAGKIVGGEPVDLGDLPYMAIVGNGTLFCGGAIISPMHILTGAQCIHSKIGSLESAVRVQVGTLHPAGGDLHYVKHVLIHPEFLKNFPEYIIYDIGILTLCKRIIFDADKQPVRLPNKEVRDGMEGVVAGWGSFGKKNVNQILMQVTMNVYSYPTCSKHEYFGSQIRNQSQICTLDSTNKGICDVDQGGPLLINGVIVGIASLTQGVQCEQGKAIFTSVYQSLSFIRKIIDPLVCKVPLSSDTTDVPIKN